MNTSTKSRVRGKPHEKIVWSRVEVSGWSLSQIPLRLYSKLSKQTQNTVEQYSLSEWMPVEVIHSTSDCEEVIWGPSSSGPRRHL